jgi:hypothetical protein
MSTDVYKEFTEEQEKYRKYELLSAALDDFKNDKLHKAL